MEKVLVDILDALRAGEVNAAGLERILRRHNKAAGGAVRRYSKKDLMPFYLRVRAEEPERWAAWSIDAGLEARLLTLLQIKPRRTASGVATITVITKPWGCSSDCLYCPNDVRMPKSYMANEPACQRAERNWFDPYLQVSARLHTLQQMGHVTDKIELIVLGGTWSDYPETYQIWFMRELFRALNDGGAHAEERRAFYQSAALPCEPDDCAAFVKRAQNAVFAGELTYNQAWARLYAHNPAWEKTAAIQTATLDELLAEHAVNETATHRVVGLVVETRPDLITAPNLTLLRRLGCTKVQMGVQTLNAEILAANRRNTSAAHIQNAFELLRAFGFKIHAHFMVNLKDATPEADKADYRHFAQDAPYQPDEVKLYPCALIDGTHLCDCYKEGTWQPYDEETLLDVLVADTLATPAYTRISRMIRDFSAGDIVAGNKKINLRQLVEERMAASSETVQEIRFREISTDEVDAAHLTLRAVPYATTATDEVFLQWVTPENRIAGFLRLSLPHADYIAAHPELPVAEGEAMIREVHVYGKVAGLHRTSSGAQHLGLGRKLIAEAERIAREHGYTALNVISAIGTREYYRSLGFADNGLYQQRPL